MKYTLHPGAEDDLTAACDRYALTASGRLVVRFIDEFERVALLLAREPGLGTSGPSGRAIFPLRGFPYSVIYKPTASGIRVLVVRHQHRDPAYGSERT